MKFALDTIVPILAVLFNAAVQADQMKWSEILDQYHRDRQCFVNDFCHPSLSHRNAKNDSLFAMGSSLGNERKSTLTASDNLEEDNTVEDILKAICYCDEDCRRYGDCCLDAASVYSDEAGDEDRYWSCLPLRRLREDERVEMLYIYMIAKCPPTGTDGPLAAKCAKQTEQDANYSHLMDVPVLSLKTNLTYANIFCAECHLDNQHLANWSVSIECDERLAEFNVTLEAVLDPGNYQAGMSYWSITRDPIAVDGVLIPSWDQQLICQLTIQELEDTDTYINMTGSRRCYRPIVNRCADDWPHPEDWKACSAYASYVEENHSPDDYEFAFRGRQTVKVYKNPHCARCNHVALNQTRCFDWKDYLAQVRMNGIPIEESFPITIDFGGQGERVGQVKKCAPNEIYDHIHQRCANITCGQYFTIGQDGNCIATVDDSPPVDRKLGNSSILSLSCPTLVIVESIDYTLTDNGSLALNQTGELLNPDQYELLGENGTLAKICIEDSLQHDRKFSLSHKLLSDICLTLSLIGLALHIGIHVVLPKLRNLPGKNLLAHSCTLFIAQLLFLTAIGARESVGYELCAVFAILTHWFYLSSYFWMNVMSFDIYSTFVGQARNPMAGRDQRHTFYIYSMYAWGCPTLIVGSGLLLDLTDLLDVYAPEYGTRNCWICNKNGLGVLFALPIGILLLENCALFSLTVHSILKQRRAAKFATEREAGSSSRPLRSKEADRKLLRKQEIRFLMYVKLMLIMGLGWAFGFIASIAQVSVLWYAFTIFNALQGAYIFFAFDFKRKVYHMLYYWMTKRPHPLDTSSSSRCAMPTGKRSTDRNLCSTSNTTSVSIQGVRRNVNRQQSTVEQALV